jgi:hypothetical protein
MPSSKRTDTPHCNRRRRNNQIGQPEEWMEGSLHVSRYQQQQLPMPSQSTWLAIPPSSTSWRHGEDLLIIVLGKGRQSRHHRQTYQPSTKICHNETPIPHQQGDPNILNQHTLPAKRRSKRSSIGRLL